jgi:hypothetical protein
MPLLQAKQHKIQSIQPFWNGNIPIAPIQMRRICPLLFLEIMLRLDEPVFFCGNLCLPSSDGDSLAKN